MWYLYLKSMHIIFMVTWFAGMFYMVRLLIYFAEAQSRNIEERAILLPQYKLMMKRLWYMITWPGMVLTTLFGIWMIYINWTLLYTFWFQLKIFLLVGLIGYHLYTEYLLQQANRNRLVMGSEALRLYNEIATLFLFAIVLLAVVKNSLNMLYGFIFLVGLGILLGILIKLYKNHRNKK